MREQMVGKYLTLGELCECTNTYKAFAQSINPFPQNHRSIDSLRLLAQEILDPVIDHFGLPAFKLTYGFCSHDLRRKLISKNPNTGKPYGRVAPSLDQHLAEETDREGLPVCSRRGAAADFRIESLSSRSVVAWLIEQALPFDRLYYYGDDRAIHVSYGPEHNRYLCAFSKRNTPEQRSIRDLVDRAREVYLK